ncbi:phosphatase PAP2 family protein [Lacrimispora sp.]|uniref:phosphatase PAP2 family protein n=1 Tax=Lacrimispora sp. TaxID=2719234 RepID=UPI00289A3F5D|nr:phosphatase PAP2 family protein [Lacrimispora sp.]
MTGTEFSILYFLQSLHTPWLDVLMKEITSLGDHGIFWILTGVILLCFKNTRIIGLCVILSLAVGFLVGNTFLKNVIARERPCWIDSSVPLLIHNPRDYSFPSGHTLASFEGAVSIWLYNRKWGTAALILAALIGFSRMYLFVHFPTDVLGGLILGVLIAFLVHSIVEKGRNSKKNICFPGNL